MHVGIATPTQRERIYRLRHDIYARELGQHAERADGALTDELDERNVYIAATISGRIAGFVSITPPGARYSIDKYFAPDALPVARDDGLFEIRLLSVVAEQRGGLLAALLMYAALRFVEERGGKHIVALGRDEVLDLYLGVGMREVGATTRSGAVLYHLLEASPESVRAAIAPHQRIVDRLAQGVRWQLPVSFSGTPACYHGGAFFEAIGEEFDTLERSKSVISADVLDAWFPPSPRVMEAIEAHLPWLVRTSPPTSCAGLVRTIARVQGVGAESILPGGGSSDLIFLALTRWLNRDSRVLILDPMYGEYAHVLEQVIGCRVDRLVLSRDEGYTLNIARLAERLRSARYDLCILVNPNSPTGRHAPRAALETAIAEVSRSTRMWVDETYVEYAGAGESLERFASTHEGVVVCKSMSKVYGLSGVRVGYLCASPATINALRPYSPPWAVGLIGQVAAVHALNDQSYYREQWAVTRGLRDALGAGLRRCGLDVVPGIANFVLCHLPADGPSAGDVVSRAREFGLFLRDVGPMGSALGKHAIRVAVKDAETNGRMLGILERVLESKQG
jgi:histidinol-phosphate/aromatic aminotransferase/cobyric acid decarboxylase-like protein/N-acyl-L-homoserine lactone synthetase